MKKSEIIGLNNVINSVQDFVNKKVFTKEEVEPFNYLFVRNLIKFKPVLKEQEAIVKELIKDADLEEKTVDEQNVIISNILKGSEDYQNFLKEDTDIKLFTIPISKLDGKTFNLEVATSLIGLLIIDEDVETSN